MRAPLVYIIRKNITVQIYGDYFKYVTHDDEMIARMLHLPPDNSRLHNEQSAQMADYMIDNRSVYDIFDQICKDTDLYPYVNQHKSKRDGRGVFYAIHSRWFGPNHVNVTACQNCAADVCRCLCMREERRHELGNVCCLTCQVPYYPGKPNRIRVPRPSGVTSCSQQSPQ